VSGSTTNKWTYGSTNSVENSFQANSAINVPAGKVLQAVATTKQAKVNIPYTGRVHFADTVVTKTISGTYEGVNFYYLTQSITDLTSSFS
jgi:hypothetical protein